MSYDHTKVDDLEEYVIPDTSNLLATHVMEDVLDFARALASKMRDVKFAVMDHSSLHVYMEGDLFTMGTISHGYFPTDVKGVRPDPLKATYGVYARSVCNTRCGVLTERYNMKTTGSLKVAVSNALRHLRRYTHVECARAFVGKLGVTMNNCYSTLDEQIDKDARKLVCCGYYAKELMTSPLGDELREMIATGHEWHDPSTGAGLTKLFADNSTLEGMGRSTVPFKFVRVIEKRGEPYLEAMDVPMKVRSNLLKLWNEIPVTEYCVRYGIPEALQGSLAVLQMCEVDQYVDNVGMKMCGGGYYVYDTAAE